MVLSTSSHKEPRFLVPILPLLLIVSVKGYQKASRTAVVVSLVINFLLFFSSSVYGREGAYQALGYIRHEKDVTGVMFLTECHLTPFYSVMHQNVPARFPDCSPLNRIKGNE